MPIGDSADSEFKILLQIPDNIKAEPDELGTMLGHSVDRPSICKARNRPKAYQNAQAMSA
jgi:hypothetical protein